MLPWPSVAQTMDGTNESSDISSGKRSCINVRSVKKQRAHANRALQSLPVSTLTVAALYYFTSLSSPECLRELLLNCCKDNNVRGTLLLASEGINGTIAGPAEGIKAVIAFVRSWPEIDGENFNVKYSSSSGQGFHHMRVKLKREIVTMGIPGIDPSAAAG